MSTTPQPIQTTPAGDTGGASGSWTPSPAPPTPVPSPNAPSAPAGSTSPSASPSPSLGIPMLNDDNVFVHVPSDKVQQEIQDHGYHVAVSMLNDDGQPVHVPFQDQDMRQKQSGYTWTNHPDNALVQQYIKDHEGVVQGASAPSRADKIWHSIVHPEPTGVSSINLGSQGGDAPQSLPANSQPGTIEQGAEKGLTATMGGVSHLVGGPGATKAETTPSSPAEWAGYALEAAAEFETGDEAFKALSAADKLKKLQAVAQIMEEHPTLARVFSVGSKFLRQGSVSDVQAFIRGASPKKALETGVLVGGSGAALDAIAPPISQWLSTTFPKSAARIAELMSAETSEARAAASAVPVAPEVPAAAESATPVVKVESPTVQTAGESIPAKGTREATVVTNVAKAKLPAGEDMAAGAQQHLQDSMTNEINSMADDAGVPRPKVSSPQQMSQEIADSVFKRSKAEYKLIDGATAGRFQPNADKLANVNLKLRNILGTDDEAEAALVVQKTKLLAQQDQIFEDAAKNGVPKDTVAAAKKDFHTAQAQYDLSSQLRLSAPSKDPNLLDPTKLRNRLTKFDVSGEGGSPSRLEQATGTTRAKSMIDHAATSQEMATMSPTESKALTQLVYKNTPTSIFRGGTTNWRGVLNDFDALGTEGQKVFSNPQGVTQFLRRQALKQAGLKWGVGSALALLPTAGTIAYELNK